MKKTIRPLATLALLAGLFLPLAVGTSASAASPVCASGAGGYSLTTLPSSASVFYNATNRARKSIELTMYELSDHTELSDLANAAKRHVDVRVVLDRDYTGGSVNAAAYSYLRAHGVHVAWGPSDTIVHQKTLSIDGSCSLISTGNLTPQYYATTRDYVVTDTNRSEVSSIISTFNSDFAGHPISSGGQVGNLLYSPNAETPLVNLISSANKSVIFESEEMDEPYLEHALEADARRGVTCEVVMTEDSEWDGAFSDLKAAGCVIRLYPNTANALYIHAKAIVVDPGTANARLFVGSQNASEASLLYNRELGLILTSAKAPSVFSGISATITKDFNAAPITY
jgi:cardiolipin synthase